LPSNDKLRQQNTIVARFVRRHDDFAKTPSFTPRILDFQAGARQASPSPTQGKEKLTHDKIRATKNIPRSSCYPNPPSRGGVGPILIPNTPSAQQTRKITALQNLDFATYGSTDLFEQELHRGAEAGERELAKRSG
jgi:hypothetical protein